MNAHSVTICPYNPDWPRDFERYRAAIQAALGDLDRGVDHIGSTSVPGLGAKDIIDIQVTVAELTEEVAGRLQAAGFSRRRITADHVPPGADPDPALWSKLLFCEPEGQRRANIHVRRLGNPNQRYPLLFRDYLRAHPASAQAVERVKRELAKHFPDDIDSYLDIKEPVYDLIWYAAQEWKSGNVISFDI